MAGWSLLLPSLSFCKSGLWHLKTLSLEPPSCQTVLCYKKSYLDVVKKELRLAGSYHGLCPCEHGASCCLYCSPLQCMSGHPSFADEFAEVYSHCGPSSFWSVAHINTVATMLILLSTFCMHMLNDDSALYHHSSGSGFHPWLSQSAAENKQTGRGNVPALHPH